MQAGIPSQPPSPSPSPSPSPASQTCGCSRKPFRQHQARVCCCRSNESQAEARTHAVIPPQRLETSTLGARGWPTPPTGRRIPANRAASRDTTHVFPGHQLASNTTTTTHGPGSSFRARSPCPSRCSRPVARAAVIIIQTQIKLHSDYVQTTFRLHSDYIQTTFRLRSDYVQTTFGLHSDCIQTAFRLHSIRLHPD